MNQDLPVNHKLHQAQSHEVTRSWQSQRNDINNPIDFILPLFICNNDSAVEPIDAMPDVSRYGCDKVLEYLDPLVTEWKLRSVLLFPVPAQEDVEKVRSLLSGQNSKWDQTVESEFIERIALDPNVNPVLRLLPRLKQKFPDLCVLCDVCICAMTSTGHCCLFSNDLQANLADSNRRNDRMSNEITCKYLARLSLEYARLGCDVIAPSDMMDGRIKTIRLELDANQLDHVGIMSYSAKFSSAFYGPFRQATNNKPEFGDRRAYQLPPGSRTLALRAVKRDLEEGADIIMVKPGLAYIDILRDIRERHPDVPLAVYQVSGEYSMLKLAAKAGLIDYKRAVNETLTSFRRSGASIMITYFTPELLRGQL